MRAVDEVANVGDCGDAYEDFLDCASDAAEVCNVHQGECVGPAFAWAGCVLGYCLANVTAPECQGLSCATSSAGNDTGCTVSQQCGNNEPRYQLDCADDECTCAVDEVTTSKVAFDPAFCTGEHDAKVAAAAAACGWPD